MFRNPLENDISPTAQTQQTATPPPAFRAWADEQIKSMSGGTASTWDDLDKAFENVPAAPGEKPKDTASDLRKRLADSYVDDVLPQYYRDPKVLSQAQAFAKAKLAPQLMAGAFKPAIAASTTAKEKDPLALQQESYTRLMQDTKRDASERASAGIKLDAMARANGRRIIADMKLEDTDTAVAVDVLDAEKVKRDKLAEEVIGKYQAGQITHEDAQAQLDTFSRENQDIEGAKNELRDTNDVLSMGAYALGGLGKGLLGIGEIAARATSGTISGLSGEGFGKGWAEEESIGGWLGDTADAITELTEETSKYDSATVAKQYVMQLADEKGFAASARLLAENPTAAYSMLATSGVDSIAQFFAGGFAGKGIKLAGAAIASLPKVMASAPSATAMKDVLVGAVVAAAKSPEAARAFKIGGVLLPATAGAAANAREVGDHLRQQYDAMSTDKFLSMQDIQAERDVWSGMDDARLQEYINNRKEELVGDAMAAVTATNTAFLAASGYLGTKYGMEKFLLGKVGGEAAGEAVTRSVPKAMLASGALGSAHEGGEEAFETGIQHVMTNAYLDKPASTPTPFDNFAGSILSGMVVGGPMDAAGSYFTTRKSNDAAAAAQKTKAEDEAKADAAAKAEATAEAAADKAEAADVDAAIAAATEAKRTEDMATALRPQTWTGGAYVDEDGTLVTTEAARFTDDDLADPDVQARIDAAYGMFTREDDAFSPASIMAAEDGMGTSGVQRRQIMQYQNVAETSEDPVMAYRAKSELLRLTNAVRAHWVSTHSGFDALRNASIQGTPGKAPAPGGTYQGNLGGLLPAPEYAQTPAGPNSYPGILLGHDGTIYGQSPANTLPVPSGPLESAPYVHADWSIEPAGQVFDPNVIYGGPPDAYTDIGEGFLLPAPAPQPDRVTSWGDWQGLLPALTAPVDMRDADGLAGFPAGRWAARGHQQLAVVAAEKYNTPELGEDDLLNAVQAGRERAAAEAAAAQAAQEQATPTQLRPSRTAAAIGANLPVTSHATTLASTTTTDGTVGAQVAVKDDGSSTLILSTDAGNEVRVHTVDLDRIVAAATKQVGKENPLEATQVALTAAMNRVRAVGLSAKAIVPAARLVIARAALAKVKAEDLASLQGKKLKKKLAGIVLLQRTIEEDKARVLDGPRGKVALEYVTGLRDTLPKGREAHRAALEEARVNWHRADNLLRESGYYHAANAAAARAGIGKPKVEAPAGVTPAEADTDERAAMVANEAADAVVAGETITAEQADYITEAVPDTPAPSEPPQLSGYRQAMAAYESDPRTLRWKELKTREDAAIRAGQPVPERSAQEKADSAWAKRERTRITRMQIADLKGPSDLLANDIRDADLEAAIEYVRAADATDAAMRAYLTAEGQDIAKLIRAYRDVRVLEQLHPGNPKANELLERGVRVKGWVDGIAPFIDSGTKMLATLTDDVAVRVFGRQTAVHFLDQVNASRHGPANGEYRMNRANAKGVVFANRGTGRDPLSARGVGYTIAHEQNHRVTAAVLAWGQYLAENQRELESTMTPNDVIALRFFENIQEIIQATKNRMRLMGISDDAIAGIYGLSSEVEFVAEIMRPEFRTMLDKIHLGKRETVLHRVMKAIMQMLGVRHGSALDNALTAMGNMWLAAEQEGNAAEFYGPIPTTGRIARAVKAGAWTPEYDAWVASTLEDAPINGATMQVLNDTMEDC